MELVVAEEFWLQFVIVLLEAVVLAVVVALFEDHLVLGQGASFVGANDRGTAESFNRRQRSEIIQQK